MQKNKQSLEYLRNKNILLFSNSARLTVRTTDMVRLLSRQNCFVQIISWSRGPNDIPNHEGLGPHEQVVIPAENILRYILKAFLVAVRFKGEIFMTMDIRLIPCLFILSKFFKGAVIFDCQELPSVTAQVRLNEWLPVYKYEVLKSVVYRIYLWFEEVCFKIADGVYCLDSRDDFLYRKAKSVNRNVTVIMNVVDPLPKIVNQSAAKYKNRYKNKSAMVFSGGFFPDKGAEQYLSALNNLRYELTDVRLVICGTIKFPLQDFRELVNRYNVGGLVDFYPHMPFNEHLGLLSNCKVGLALMQSNRPKFNKIGPGTARKIFTYMAAGLPIVISRGHFARIVENENCGIVVDFDDVIQLTTVLRTLFFDEKLRTRLGDNGLHAVETKYNMVYEEKKFFTVLKSALVDRGMVQHLK